MASPEEEVAGRPVGTGVGVKWFGQIEQVAAFEDMV